MPRPSTIDPATYSAGTQAVVAWFFGVDLATINRWLGQGMPEKRNGEYDLSEIARWLGSVGPWRPRVRGGRAAVDDKTEVRDELRDIKVETARMALMEKKKQLADVDEICDWLDPLADSIRRTGDLMARKPSVEGAEVQRQLNDIAERIVGETKQRRVKG